MAGNLEKKISGASFFVDEEEFEFLDFSEEDDNGGDLGRSLLGWEFIDASDAESEDEPPKLQEQQDHDQVSVDEEDEEIEDHNNGSETEPQEIPVPRFLDPQDHTDRRHFSGDDDRDHGDDDYDDYDNASDLNDELVPWSVSDRLGRQRMRKQGKRGFSKAQSTKKSPHLAKRPGVVRGKHGLGVKHSL